MVELPRTETKLEQIERIQTNNTTINQDKKAQTSLSPLSSFPFPINKPNKLQTHTKYAIAPTPTL